MKGTNAVANELRTLEALRDRSDLPKHDFVRTVAQVEMLRWVLGITDAPPSESVLAYFARCALPERVVNETGGDG